MSSPVPLRLSGIVLSLAAVSVAAAALGTMWWFNEPNPTIDQDAQKPRHRPLTLVASGDTAGWITPCGCVSNQSGGLLRRGTYVSELRRRSDVILTDVGGAAAGTSVYDRAKFEAILRGEIAMGIDAHNMGDAELKLGTAYLRHAVQSFSAPLISANLLDATGNRVLPSHKVVRVAGHSVALIGVLSERYEAGNARIANPRDAVLQTIEDMTDPYDWLIVLAYLPEDELRRLASELPEADVIIGGPTGQNLAPIRAGPCLVTSATNRARFLVELQAAGGPTDPAWTARSIELTSRFDDDPIQRRNLDSFYAELARRDLSASETGFVTPWPQNLPADYRVAGTRSCAACHDAEDRHWQASRHAHAWQSLVDRGAQVDPYCQQCHSTGYGLPGGFQSIFRSPDRFAVGCESCHGPSYGHVQKVEIRTPFTAKDQCLGCHDHENSPEFEYDEYWRKIQHGESSKRS